eukprot:8598109-Pyramimonas_sp.AAC.1
MSNSEDGCMHDGHLPNTMTYRCEGRSRKTKDERRKTKATGAERCVLRSRSDGSRSAEPNPLFAAQPKVPLEPLQPRALRRPVLLSYTR